MPTKDGIEAAQSILSAEGQEGIKEEDRPSVYIVTSSDLEEARERAEGLGLGGVMPKPLTVDTLHHIFSLK